MNMGERLRRKRHEAKIGQKKLAQMIGVSASTIAYVELGKRSMSYKMAKKFADALGETPEYYLGMPSDKEPRSIDVVMAELKSLQPVSIAILTETADGTLEEAVGYEYWSKEKVGKRNIMGLKTYSDCFPEAIRAGDILFVDIDLVPFDGNLVVCIRGDKLCIGRLRQDGSQIWVENESGITSLEQCFIVGVVFEKHTNCV